MCSWRDDVYDSTGSCMHILSVCKMWREVGLQEARLRGFWGSFPSARCLEVFNSRSKETPLYLRLDDQSMRASGQSYSRTQCPTQAVELHMSCELSNIQGLLETFNQPEDAQVDCGIESLFIRNKSRGKFRLPSPFYVCQFPHLSHIELVSCYVDWGSPMFYNTRLMYLYVSGMEVTNKPSLLDFLGILQN